MFKLEEKSDDHRRLYSSLFREKECIEYYLCLIERHEDILLLWTVRQRELQSSLGYKNQLIHVINPMHLINSSTFRQRI